MYEAKEGGKRRFAVFTPEMRDSIVRRHDLKEELERAIEQRELVVQYQPIVDIPTGEAISVEALVRWNHPDRGRIPPLEFIPLAEDTGLIVPLGRYVLEEACARVVRRSDTLQVQVNLCAIELEHPDLIQTITDVLAAHRHRPGPARARGHRDPAREGRRARRRDAPAAPRPRRAARAGRLRHRLLAR